MTYENAFKAMLTTRIGVKEIVWGEFIWVGLKGAVMAVGVTLVLASVGLMANPFLIPLAATVGFFVAVPCGAMGLLSTAFVKNINQFQTVYSFLIAPLFYLSGIFFPLDNMHVSLRVAAEFFPLVHGVRLAQSIFWNKGLLEAFAYSGSILLLQSAVFCTWAYYKIRKKLIS
jgi:lipooligosaccharide transport system permease protein